ncbi:phospholipase D-like domain-containing protein [Jeotgalibaca sp. A122]|uniref:phospholipase D-like domain-containing protein n=1 Tax=Jeotgalibaca sp. A122 TaxID=3457322 RepID=UPI003FD5F120
MPNAQLIYDSPSLYADPEKYYLQGSSPTILKKFTEYIEMNKENITEINASLYLYNNPILHSFFKKLSEQGIKINIISIPLEGYDNSYPKKITNLKTSNFCFNGKPVSKYDVADAIYKDSINYTNPNFRMYIFPHMYIRSRKVKKFSRGNMPYSLHIKSFYIKFKNGSHAVALTSSNLAVRDKIKDELMIICENFNNFRNSAQIFFTTLITNSISIESFNQQKKFNHYQIIKKPNYMVSEPEKNHNFYMGPFFYQSQSVFENYLIDLVKKSKNRIYICGQHVSAYSYYVTSNSTATKRYGFLNELLKETKKDIEIRILSQTFVDENNHSHGKRKPVNTHSFKEFIKNYTITNKHLYAVNDSVHCKFIIVDDIAVITSCNFTPTQFIYSENINIEEFDNIPDFSYSGIHSEVGEYIVIKNKDVCDSLIRFFNYIWCKESTYHHS